MFISFIFHLHTYLFTYVFQVSNSKDNNKHEEFCLPNPWDGVSNYEVLILILHPMS